MKALDSLYRLWLRFRHPLSLPEEIAHALGIPLSNALSFEELLEEITRFSSQSLRLKKFMPREEAEREFQTALAQERFSSKSLFSYYFTEGWIEFALCFDEQNRLRRLYIQHTHLKDDRGIELVLNMTEAYPAAASEKKPSSFSTRVSLRDYS